MEKNGFISKAHFRSRAGSLPDAAHAKANAARSKATDAAGSRLKTKAEYTVFAFARRSRRHPISNSRCSNEFICLLTAKEPHGIRTPASAWSARASRSPLSRNFLRQHVSPCLNIVAVELFKDSPIFWLGSSEGRKLEYEAAGAASLDRGKSFFR